MARAPSAILTPAQQKVADSLSTLKAELKAKQIEFKELAKTAKAATKAVDTAAKEVTKLEAQIDKASKKLAPKEPVLPTGTAAAISNKVLAAAS